jgi:DNA-directed RNA polymerase specialized sigma24 family protein
MPQRHAAQFGATGLMETGGYRELARSAADWRRRGRSLFRPFWFSARLTGRNDGDGVREFHKTGFPGRSRVNAPPWKGAEDRSEIYPDDAIRAWSRIIARACLCSGLSSADADDLAQDLWEWLIRTGVPMTVIATPWLEGAVYNYIRRFRRRSSWRHRREGQPLETGPEPQSLPLLPVLESNDLLDRIAAILPKRERSLLDLVRRGYSIAEAGRILGIPRGSCAYHRGRLVAYARRAMKRRSSPPPGGTEPHATIRYPSGRASTNPPSVSGTRTSFRQQLSPEDYRGRLSAGPMRVVDPPGREPASPRGHMVLRNRTIRPR